MNETVGPVFSREGNPFQSGLLRPPFEEWGLWCADIVNPPRRFWSDAEWNIPAVESGVDVKRLTKWPTPTELLRTLTTGDNWQAQTRRSLGRLQSYFLVCEDPQRRMDARPVETLAHQVSLVRHVLDSESLKRVLVADEVGLGKTVEIGLLLQELLEQRPGLRILYLAPARLVSNVRREFDRLRLPFRQWTAVDCDARLDDTRIIASIHRAVHGDNFKRVIAAGPWDILIVDECHHLSAWSPDGGDPREAYRLVRDLISKQPEGARTILLSGTPHQGHPTRFENLLGLLQAEKEGKAALAGRVIYRTKDDIQDWGGNPLFPPRQVNEPLVVDLGPRYRAWIEHIHDFYMPPPGASASDSRRRAAGWRCAQALQWAASSSQAGLGYLVRQAIRAGWDSKHPMLLKAIGFLRPYRGGLPNEPIDALLSRIVKEVERQKENADIDDIEEDAGESPDKVLQDGLAELLEEGIAVLRECGDHKWLDIKRKLIDPAGNEKIVLFAQPIETVTAVAAFLERHTGIKPAVIVGGQSDRERTEVVEAFRRPDGPQFLVSTRAGGEGLNLQTARRLIHLDVPWNPMELEQRVGRVHRFGSRRTILVDTVVVKDSREADAYRVAREKLSLIASTLVTGDKFEAVFSRVMCLVPPEELQQVLIREVGGRLDHAGQEDLARMVQSGFDRWKSFHEKYGQEQQRIRQQDPGLVAWEDVIKFAREQAGAVPAAGFVTQRFVRAGKDVSSVEDVAPVLKMPDGRFYSCGDCQDAPVFGPTEHVSSKLGLNSPPIAEALRRLAFPDLPTGAAHLRWKLISLPGGIVADRFGVLLFLRQTLRTDSATGWLEQSTALKCFVVSSNENPPFEIEDIEKQSLLRGLFGAVVRAKPETDDIFLNAMTENEKTLIDLLRRPTETEMRRGIRHAVTPVFAAIVETAASN